MDTTDIKLLRRYPGSKPFDESESGLFNGREDDIERLHERTRLHNLNVIYGRSGLGKSSLLNAGLKHKLNNEAGIDSYVIKFGSYFKETAVSPVQKLINDFKGAEGIISKTFLSEKFKPEQKTWVNQLWFLLKNKQIANPQIDTFVLILDQFEEIFTYPDEEISAFKKLLSELLFVKMPQEIRNSINEKVAADSDFFTKEEAAILFAPLNVKVLFAIDADKLSLLNNFTDFFPSILQSCYELKPLNSMQARSAIVAPARLTDPGFISPPFLFSNDLLDIIILALTAGKKGKENKDEIEPFQLQLVCRHAEDVVIETGDAEMSVQDLGNIKKIFENHYINIISKLPVENQLPARRLIEEKLIIDGARVSMPISFILRDKGMTRELLESLTDTHILKTEQNNTVEISHDTFLDPILKYYDERKKEELIAGEQEKKEEQIRIIKEEQEKLNKEQRQKQELELQRLESKRNKQKMNFAVAIGLFISLSLAGIITWQNSIRREREAFLKHRRAAYQRLGKMRGKIKTDPTLARTFIKQALDSLAVNDSDSRNVILKADTELVLNSFFYKNKVVTKPGSFMAVSADRGRIVTCNNSGQDSLWDINGKFLKTISLGRPVRCAAFSGNSKFVLLGLANGELKRWNWAAGRILDIAGAGSPIMAARYSPDDKYFLVLTLDQKVSIFDSLGKQLSELPGNTYTCAIFSQNSDTVLTGSSGEGEVSLWNVHGKKLGSYKNWGAPITALSFTPHGGRFVSGNQKGFASIWHKFATEKPLVTFGDLGYISAVSFINVYKDSLADDDIGKNKRYNYLKVCTGDTAGNMKIWMVKYTSGDFIAEHQNPAKNFNMLYWYSVIAELKGHKGRIYSISKINDSTIASCSADGTVKTWDISKAILAGGQAP